MLPQALVASLDFVYIKESQGKGVLNTKFYRKIIYLSTKREEGEKSKLLAWLWRVVSSDRFRTCPCCKTLQIQNTWEVTSLLPSCLPGLHPWNSSSGVLLSQKTLGKECFTNLEDTHWGLNKCCLIKMLKQFWWEMLLKSCLELLQTEKQLAYLY